MPKYHITPTQRILECKNPDNCCFGADTPHFDSEKEAEEYRDKNPKKSNEPLPMFNIKSDEEIERDKENERIKSIAKKAAKEVFKEAFEEIIKKF